MPKLATHMEEHYSTNCTRQSMHLKPACLRFSSRAVTALSQLYFVVNASGDVQMPRLAIHMEEEYSFPTAYCSQWVLTLYAYAFHHLRHSGRYCTKLVVWCAECFWRCADAQVSNSHGGGKPVTNCILQSVVPDAVCLHSPDRTLTAGLGCLSP